MKKEDENNNRKEKGFFINFAKIYDCKNSEDSIKKISDDQRHLNRNEIKKKT
jgi:hypothetical protein